MYTKPIKPLVHLWIYNHPFYGISDQINYFITILRQNNYPVTIGKYPKNNALNIVIENFSLKTSEILINFCLKTKKRVGIIMTEHIDFDVEKHELQIHGQPLWTENDYMPAAKQVERLTFLLRCLPYIRSFFRLGDLPELNNFNTILPHASLHTLPFPKLDFVNPTHTENIKNHFLFTGLLTEYRKQLLRQLNAIGISIYSPTHLVSKKRREQLITSSKIILNIPQRKNWTWLSLMRIIANLKQGRPTISLGTKDSSIISNCCTQLDIDTNSWPLLLKNYIPNWKDLYEQHYENYVKIIESFNQKHPFPEKFFEHWAITDQIPKDYYVDQGIQNIYYI